MRLSLFCVLLLICIVSGRYHYSLVENEISTYPEHKYTQRLNHFDPEDQRTFSQRYWVNNDHWNRGDAPIFLYINGEGMVKGPPSNSTSLVVQLAEQHQGIIVTLEHRYYGKSHYFDQLTTNNLRYLTTEQALRDLASFITWFRSQTKTQFNLPQAKFKIFTIGVSYSGALSAWFRIKYPHITVGSLASSGVVNAIKDFGQYDGQVPASVGQTCTKALRIVTKTIQKAIDINNSTAYKIRLNATQLNDADFNYMIGDIGATMVQYGRRAYLCDPLVKALPFGEKALMDAYIKVSNEIFFKSFGTAESYDVNFIYDPTVVPERNGRQWWWQTCTEFGWFQTAAKNGGIRSKEVNLEYFLGFCQQVFGQPFNPPTDATNIFYGGDHPAGTNIYFANGSQDPWQWASFTSNIYSSEPALILQCDNCGHGCDVGGCPGGCNPPGVREAAISEIKSYVSRWISNSK